MLVHSAGNEDTAERLTHLIKDTVSLICRSSLQYTTEISLEGIIGVKLDRKEIFIINVNELVTNDNLSKNAADKVSAGPSSGKKPGSAEDDSVELLTSEDETRHDASLTSRTPSKRKRKRVDIKDDVTDLTLDEDADDGKDSSARPVFVVRNTSAQPSHDASLPSVQGSNRGQRVTPSSLRHHLSSTQSGIHGNQGLINISPVIPSPPGVSQPRSQAGGIGSSASLNEISRMVTHMTTGQQHQHPGLPGLPAMALAGLGHHGNIPYLATGPPRPGNHGNHGSSSAERNRYAKVMSARSCPPWNRTDKSACAKVARMITTSLGPLITPRDIQRHGAMQAAVVKDELCKLHADKKGLFIQKGEITSYRSECYLKPHPSTLTPADTLLTEAGITHAQYAKNFADLTRLKDIERRIVARFHPQAALMDVTSSSTSVMSSHTSGRPGVDVTDDMEYIPRPGRGDLDDLSLDLPPNLDPGSSDHQEEPERSVTMETPPLRDYASSDVKDPETDASIGSNYSNGNPVGEIAVSNRIKQEEGLDDEPVPMAANNLHEQSSQIESLVNMTAKFVDDL